MDNRVLKGKNVRRWFIFYSLSVLFWLMGVVFFTTSLFYKTYVRNTITNSFLPGYYVLVKEFVIILIMVVGFAMFWPFWLFIAQPVLSDMFKYEWFWIIITIWKLIKIGAFGALVYDINIVPKRQKYSTMDLYLLGAALSFGLVSMMVRQMVHIGRCINLEGPLVDMAVGIALCMPDEHRLKLGKWIVISTAIVVITQTFYGDYMKYLDRTRRVPPHGTGGT